MSWPQPAHELEAVELLGAQVHFLPGAAEPLSELAPEGLPAHHARLGARPDCSGVHARRLLDTLDQVALTGRGGAHFPVATKWRTVLHAGPGTVVVANGAEGEPLSRKDAALLELRPHLVLDGLMCAAEALRAQRTVLWLHDDAHRARAAVTRALTERSSHGEGPLEVAFAPTRYLSGESSSVVNALSGRAALPSLARVPAARSGVDGRPTLVQNVETLARVGLLARGAAADTALVTVAARHHSVVAEVPGTATVAAAVSRTIGGRPPYAVLVGGYGGRWVSWREARTVPVQRAGAGVLLPLVPGQCGLRRTADIVDYLAGSGAGQCGPCRFGLPASAELVRELADAHIRPREVRRLERYLAEINGRGACHHPDGAVSVVRSALAVFATDVEAHLRGRCRHEPARHG
ncbi:MAG TPA: NADH-ubiquinone oxidoreductase-F iron-sulfur binding region domain-containing protein [Jatrophihabitans sp.]|jgi:NADH:ubiquinone oxidoreductase subunit F (NADH-binding)